MTGLGKGAKKLIHYDASQLGKLKCDAAGCGYNSPIPHEFGPHLIGLPCPRCGASLLTERDYRDAMKHLAVIDNINRWFGWLGTKKPSAKATIVTVNVHDGATIIKRKDAAP